MQVDAKRRLRFPLTNAMCNVSRSDNSARAFVTVSPWKCVLLSGFVCVVACLVVCLFVCLHAFEWEGELYAEEGPYASFIKKRGLRSSSAEQSVSLRCQKLRHNTIYGCRAGACRSMLRTTCRCLAPAFCVDLQILCRRDGDFDVAVFHHQRSFVPMASHRYLHVTFPVLFKE